MHIDGNAHSNAGAQCLAGDGEPSRVCALLGPAAHPKGLGCRKRSVISLETR